MKVKVCQVFFNLGPPFVLVVFCLATVKDWDTRRIFARVQRMMMPKSLAAPSRTKSSIIEKFIKLPFCYVTVSVVEGFCLQSWILFGSPMFILVHASPGSCVILLATSVTNDWPHQPRNESHMDTVSDLSLIEVGKAVVWPPGNHKFVLLLCVHGTSVN